MLIVCRYKIVKEEDGVLRMINVPSSFCPECGERLVSRDSRLRTFLDADGERHFLRHRRLICRKCGRIHSELPDFIVPEKHYTADAILGVISGVESSVDGKWDLEKEDPACAAENSTISEWMLQIFCRIQVIFCVLWKGVCTFRRCGSMLQFLDFLEPFVAGELIRRNYGQYIQCLYGIDHCICCVQ